MELYIVDIEVRTPLGNGEQTFQRIFAGESAVQRLPEIPDFMINETRIGGLLDDDDIASQIRDILPAERARTLLGRATRPVQWISLVAYELLSRNGLTRDGQLHHEFRPRTGIFVGAGMAHTRRIGDAAHTHGRAAEAQTDQARSEYMRQFRRSHKGGFTAAEALPESVATRPALDNKLRGPGGSVIRACATGAANIIAAAEKIILQEADLMLAGGVEELAGWVFHVFNEIGLGGALSKHNDLVDAASRPFDANASGFVASEAAALVLIANEKTVQQWNLPVIAKIKGWGENVDATSITDPNSESQEEAIRKALSKAQLNPADINFVKAHATSTRADRVELGVIKSAIGLHPLIWAPKGAVAHTLGAAGALETVLAIKAMQKGKIPPTRNLTNPIPELVDCRVDHVHTLDCPRLFHVSPTATDHQIQNMLLNAFGFWGQNSCLVIGKP